MVMPRVELSGYKCSRLRQPRFLIVLSLIVALVWMLIAPSLTLALAGLGDYISESVLGDGVGENLHLGDGTNELVVVGSGPSISTLPVTDIDQGGGVITATLRGNLANLNGMPRADVWFVWGYAPDAMVNTTVVNTVVATGEQTTAITPIAGEDVFYQFYSSTDGTLLGEILSFNASGTGYVTSFDMLAYILPIVIALGLFIGILVLTGNPIAALLFAIIGLLAFYIVQAFVQII